MVVFNGILLETVNAIRNCYSMAFVVSYNGVTEHRHVLWILIAAFQVVHQQWPSSLLSTICEAQIRKKRSSLQGLISSSWPESQGNEGVRRPEILLWVVHLLLNLCKSTTTIFTLEYISVIENNHFSIQHGQYINVETISGDFTTMEKEIKQGQQKL